MKARLVLRGPCVLTLTDTGPGIAPEALPGFSSPSSARELTAWVWA
jgi:hypothetical protein